MVVLRDKDAANREISNAITDMALAARELDASNAARLFSAGEQELIQKGGWSDFELLEIRRRVAEAKFSHCISKSGFSYVADELWADLERLGFSSFEREATMLMLLVRHHLRMGTRSKIDEILDRLDRVVSQAQITADNLQEASRKLRAEAEAE